MAFSSRGLCSCSSTRAQNKFCGLAAVIQSRMERGQRAVGWDDVSREIRGPTPSNRTLTVSFRLHVVILSGAKNLPTSRPTHPPRAEILRRRLLRMTTRSGTMGGSRPKSRLFHVKHHVFLRTPSPFQCAPESPPEAAGFILRMFQPHVGDQAGLPPCSGSSNLQSAKAREEYEPVFDTETRVPSIPAKRSHTKNRKSRTAPHPAADFLHFSAGKNLGRAAAM